MSLQDESKDDAEPSLGKTILSDYMDKENSDDYFMNIQLSGEINEKDILPMESPYALSNYSDRVNNRTVRFDNLSGMELCEDFTENIVDNSNYMGDAFVEPMENSNTLDDYEDSSSPDLRDRAYSGRHDRQRAIPSNGCKRNMSDELAKVSTKPRMGAPVKISDFEMEDGMGEFFKSPKVPNEESRGKPTDEIEYNALPPNCLMPQNPSPEVARCDSTISQDHIPEEIYEHVKSLRETNTDVNVSEKSFQEGSDSEFETDMPEVKFQSRDFEGHVGFSTAGGKPLKISEQGLHKARILLQEFGNSDFSMIPPPVNQNLLVSSKRKNKFKVPLKTHEVTARSTVTVNCSSSFSKLSDNYLDMPCESLGLARTILRDKSTENKRGLYDNDVFLDEWVPEFDGGDMSYGPTDASTFTVAPATFATASGKSIKISKESFARAQGILASVTGVKNDKQDDFAEENNLSSGPSSKMNSVKNTAVTFLVRSSGTAKYKDTEVQDAVNVDEVFDNISHPERESHRSIASNIVKSNKKTQSYAGSASVLAGKTQTVLQPSNPKCKRFKPPRRVASQKRSRPTNVESIESSVPKSPKLSNQKEFSKEPAAAANDETRENLSTLETKEILDSSIALLADEGWDD